MKIDYTWLKMNKSVSRTAEAFGELRGVQKVWVPCMGCVDA